MANSKTPAQKARETRQRNREAAEQSKRDEACFERARKRIGQQYANEETTRKKMIEVLRFVRVVGAQWEGSTSAGWAMDDKRFEKYPRFELNKLAREVDRIITDYRQNRINVVFRPKDGAASDELADKMNGKFRADFNESSGGEAIDNAFDDAVTGGFGCFRMDTEEEDAFNPESVQRNIRFYPVYDPASCVFFDQNSKQYDRSDAMWATELYSLDRDSFEEQYPDALPPAALETIDTGKQFDWVTPNVVYLARYYEKRIEDVDVISYLNPLTQQTVVYDEQQIEDIKDELTESGFEEQSRRTVKKPRVYCGILSGGEWIEKPKRLPGCYIPLIPVYARRSFVDNKERIAGHATLAVDAQRLENLIVSMLADNAAQCGGDNIPIVDINMIPGPLAQAWGDRNTDRPAFLPVDSLRDADGNVIAAGQVINFTPTTPLSPAVAAILQYTGGTIQQIVGASQLENMPSNLATETVEAIFSRMDGQGALYMDNLAKSLRHAGRVWREMAREVYGSTDYIRIVQEDGSDEFVLMEGKIIDRTTKEEIGLNDLSQGRYEVEADVGEASTTRRQATVRNLTNLLATMGDASPNAAIVASLIIMNMDGEGMNDFREYARNQMILQGVIKPETDEEKAMLEQSKQNQQPDAATQLAIAENKKGDAALMGEQNKHLDLQLKALKLNVDANKAAQDGRLTEAQTIKTLADAAGVEHNQLVQVIQLLQSFGQQQQEQDNREADRLLSASQQTASQQPQQ